MTTIDEKTKLPVSIILGLLVFVVSITAWAVRVESKLNSHESTDDLRVENLQVKQDKSMELFYSIDRRLSRIEGKLGVK